MKKERTLKVWSSRVPYSLDLIEYDALAHHIHFRSVYSSLVSDETGKNKGLFFL